jgi:glycosyltransferase involved in cell wall biosynthesis
MTSISVVVTCYNEEDYIGKSVRSVIGQTRYDLIDKLVVVNDGSKDGSEEVIMEIEKEHPKIEYLYQENKGLPSARNTGLERCTGDFVALLDGDDVWLDRKVEKQMQAIKKYPDVGLIYSDFYLFGMGERKRASPNQYKYYDGDVLERFFVEDGPIVPSTALINSECLKTVGKFDPELLRGQDTDLWLRIAEEYRFHHISDPLIYRRQRTDSLGKSHFEKAKYMMHVYDKAASRNPELRPLVGERKAKSLASRGRQLIDENRRWEAIWMLKEAFIRDPSSLEVQASLVFALLPLPNWVLQQILHGARKLRGTVESV